MTTSGSDILRQALRARNRSAGYIANLAQTLGITAVALESFMTSSSKLADGVMTKLACEIFPHAEGYDPVADLLVPKKNEAKPAGIAPEPYKPKMTGAEFRASLYPPQRAAPAKGAATTSGRLSRPGWKD
jgi:hypothetical protein